MKKTISFFLLCCLLGASSANSVFAETKRGRSGKQSETRKKYSSTKRRSPSAPKVLPVVQPTALPSPEPSVPFVQQDETPDGLISGNQIVNINGNTNIIVKIGLAQHGIALIDFPASDPIYEIHPADDNYVTVGCRRREKSAKDDDPNNLGRCLDKPTDGVILRPGTAFNQFVNGVETSTIVTIQRVSGLVATIIVYPVKKITQNTNYLAFRYDAQKIAQNRAAAGLSFNLNNQPETNTSFAVTDKNPVAQKTLAQVIPAVLVENNNGETSDNGATQTEESDLSANVLAELRRVGTTKPPLKFTKPVHGLALALALHSSRISDYAIEVIAVKNTLSVPLRLIPEQPNLVIESVGEKDKGSVLTQDVAVMEIATNAGDEDVLSPGAIYYFAIAYKSPILGARQNLKASFAHRAASDEPATLLLGEILR